MAMTSWWGAHARSAGCGLLKGSEFTPVGVEGGGVEGGGWHVHGQPGFDALCPPAAAATAPSMLVALIRCEKREEDMSKIDIYVVSLSLIECILYLNVSGVKLSYF